jgi:hypothetical protein
MTDPGIAVEATGRKNDVHDHPTQPGGSRGSRSQEGRYTYPSGSRPLAGYTVKRGLGHGGFGEVYYATSDAGKEVALKLIRRNLDVELRGIRQCLNLKHPDLLAIHDIREDDRGDKWVVMEYIGGDSLEDVVAAHPEGMSVAEALAWIHGIGAGVAYLHDHGIVHRDLKPGNIFSDEGVVKIGDYGLSKFVSCSRRSGQTESVGTVHYMAPEVANGRYGKEIDIYALGVVLYEMLTGHVPFEGESVGEVLMKHLTAEPDVSRLAEPYRGVVARALEKDPAKRFSSVGEMLARLPQPATPNVRVWPSSPAAPRTPTAQKAEAAITAEAIDEEPIFRAVRQGVRQVYDGWNESNLNTPTKVVLLVVAVFLLMQTAGLVIPLAGLLLVMYACYWVVRCVVLSMRPGRIARTATPGNPFVPGTPLSPGLAAAAAHGARSRPEACRTRRWRPREKASDVLVLKPPRQRLAELLGSMLGSTLVAVTMCLVMLMLYEFHAGGLTPPVATRPEQFAWLVLVSVAGAWAVLIPSKFWEGARGEPMLRRFILMVAGLGVGMLAFGAAWLLQVDLPYDKDIATAHAVRWPPTFYQDGTPLLLAHMACFGTLFLVIRWWRQADLLRTTRMSLFSLAFCVAMAWLVASLWQYPQLWLMMAACAIAASVQLSSPWLHPRRRRQNAE